MKEVHVEILAAGDGRNYPTTGKTVTVHYDAFLPDGTQFDSTRERDKPFRFKIFSEQVIEGLDEGIAQLSVGERARLSIPPEKAYGERGFPGLVPKDAKLVFDVTLLGIDDASPSSPMRKLAAVAKPSPSERAS